MFFGLEWIEIRNSISFILFKPSLLVDLQSLLIKRTFVFPHNENVVNDTNVVVEKASLLYRDATIRYVVVVDDVVCRNQLRLSSTIFNRSKAVP